MTIKSRLLLLATISIISTVACSNTATPTITSLPNSMPNSLPGLEIEHGKQFDLQLSNSALLSANDQKYLLSFTNVLADSRCPVGTECLRPDTAIIEVTLTELGTNANPVAHLLFVDPGTSEFAAGPFTLQVLALHPPVEKVSSSENYFLTLLASITSKAPSFAVDFTSSTKAAKVGDQVIYKTTAAGLSRAHYTLTMDSVVIGITSFDGNLVRGPQTPIVKLVAWSADSISASWTIEILATGSFTLESSIFGWTDDADATSTVKGAASTILFVD